MARRRLRNLQNAEGGLPLRRIGIGGGVLVLALILLFLLLNRSDDEPETLVSEDPPSAVMCQPSEDEQSDDDEANSTATTAPTTPSTDETGSSEVALFYQNDSRWGAVEYDHSTSMAGGGDWCGQTIAQCGCAMTSVANILSLFDVVSTPDGQDLDPGSFNGWLNREAEFAGGCFISPGYYCGDVIWTDIQAFTASKRQTDPSVPLIRYRGVGNGSASEVRSELRAGRPVILELRGHFIAAVGLAGTDGQEIVIHDPFFPERSRYEEIEPFLISSRLFEMASDVSGILVMAPAEARIALRDSDGNTTGTLDEVGVHDLASGAPTEIPRSSVQWEPQWRDPTCTERAPAPDAAGNISIFIPLADPGNYTLDIERPTGDESCIAVYRYHSDGTVDVDLICGASSQAVDISYEPDPNAEPIETPTTTSTPSPTPESTDTPTPTPIVGTSTPAPTPELVATGCPTTIGVGQFLVCRASVEGTVTSFEWSSTGTPSSGSALLFSTTFDTPGTGRVVLRVCNEESCVSRTTSVTIVAAPTASFECSPATVGLGQTVTCTASADAETFAWSTSGTPRTATGSTLNVSFGAPGVQTVDLEVCNLAGCDTAGETIVVQQPIAASVACSGSGFIGQSILCVPNIIAGGPAVSFFWTAVDQFEPSPTDAMPSTGTQEAFQPQFSFAGTKLITLQICNETSCASAETTVRITSIPPPTILGFDCSPNTVFFNNPVNCSASVTGLLPGATFSWTAGGGVPASGSGSLVNVESTIDFVTSFPSVGPYQVTLTVCNGNRCSNASDAGTVIFPIFWRHD